jgi:gamma-glutamyl-gamma-aminobutyrate hydrolase PuuD
MTGPPLKRILLTMKRPLIGVTLDAEKPGGYSKFPWYALRQNYCEAVIAARTSRRMPPPTSTRSTGWW